MEVPGDLLVSRARVLDEIRATMARIGLDPASVHPAAHLVEDLDLDSLDWIDFAIQLEETLSIDLREEHFDSVRTVQDVVDCAYAALVAVRRSAG